MPIAPGAPAPEARAVPLGDGGEPLALVTLAARGPALLFFYKGDCATCAVAAHVLPRAAAIRGLAVAAISQDDAVATAVFARDHRLAAPVQVVVDPEPWRASDAFGVRATPTWVLLAPGGRVDAVLEGWSRDDANALAARAAALAGAPTAAVSTAADGPAFRPG